MFFDGETLKKNQKDNEDCRNLILELASQAYDSLEISGKPVSRDAIRDAREALLGSFKKELERHLPQSPSDPDAHVCMGGWCWE